MGDLKGSSAEGEVRLALFLGIAGVSGWFWLVLVMVMCNVVSLGGDPTRDDAVQWKRTRCHPPLGIDKVPFSTDLFVEATRPYSP